MAVREAHYQEVINRILGTRIPDRNISPKITRACRSSQQRKTKRRMICSAIGEAVEDDNRPFAHVTIEDLEFVGLLDSGALVSLHRNSERVRTAIKEVTIDHEISRWYAAPNAPATPDLNMWLCVMSVRVGGANFFFRPINRY